MVRKVLRKLDGYVRVSRVGGREGGSFVSPQLQRERIEAAAWNAGAEIAEWHEDLDESGGNSERPGFVKALERVEAGQTDGIVVAKLDRFARSVLDAQKALRRIDDADGTFISAEDGFDSSTPMGRFAQTMLFAVGRGDGRETQRISPTRARRTRRRSKCQRSVKRIRRLPPRRVKMHPRGGEPFNLWELLEEVSGMLRAGRELLLDIGAHGDVRWVYRLAPQGRMIFFESDKARHDSDAIELEGCTTLDEADHRDLVALINTKLRRGYQMPPPRDRGG